MSIIQMSLPIPSSSSRSLSSSFRFLIDPDQQKLNLLSKFSHLSLHKVVPKRGSTVIRMGGGPRTYPGGVSKWQWKRMQAKKQKQLLKGRLLRERHIYEMRKRSELKAAVSELERPWEVVERAPNLFSVKADEQLKVLADRFRKPGAYDMWSERDGPQVFHTVDGLPSTRFFPKGAVHSIKPYLSVNESEELNSDSSKNSRELGLRYDVEYGNDREMERGSGNESRRLKKSSNWISKGWSDSEGEDEDEGFRSSYSKKNSRSLGSSRGGRVGDVKRLLGSANGREVSRDFNGGRGGMGSPNGGLRRNGRNEAPFERRGRYGSNEPRQSIESRDSNWFSSEKANSDREGRNEAPFERRGRYGSNEPRQSIESRDSNLLSPEKGNFDQNDSRYGGNRPKGPRQPHGPFPRKRGNSKNPNHGEGRFGSKQRSRTWRAIPPKSSVERAKEVYDLSLIGGDSYGFQVTGQ